MLNLNLPLVNTPTSASHFSKFHPSRPVTFIQTPSIPDWSRLETQTDSELMVLIQAGDTAQLGHLFERHHLALFRYLCGVTRNHALSEDLTQEVFMRALKYASTYNPSLGFRPWLYGMARNAAYDARRKVRGEVADEHNMQAMSTPDNKPEEQIALRQHTQLLQQALNKMDAGKRELLELSRFQEMPYHEIAALLNCEVGTVKVRVYRALHDLRKRFLELNARQVA